MLQMLRSLFSGSAASASVNEAAEWVASGGVLVDVREVSEWQDGHAKGAVHVPLGELRSRGVQAIEARGVRLNEGDTVLIICQSGMRSSMACGVLGSGTGLRAVNVSGGTAAWQQAGLPMERGSGPNANSGRSCC